MKPSPRVLKRVRDQSQADDVTLVRNVQALLDKGYTVGGASRVLGLHPSKYGYVMGRLQTTSSLQVTRLNRWPDGPRWLSCLGPDCENRVHSTGKHHRLCDYCREYTPLLVEAGMVDTAREEGME